MQNETVPVTTLLLITSDNGGEGGGGDRRVGSECGSGGSVGGGVAGWGLGRAGQGPLSPGKEERAPPLPLPPSHDAPSSPPNITPQLQQPAV